MCSQLLFIGTSELLLIAALALLLFGGKKLPELMRGLGQGIRSFKEGMKDVSDEASRSADDKEQQTYNEQSAQNEANTADIVKPEHEQ
mgnify:FL=1